MKKYLIIVILFSLTTQNKAQTVTDVEGNIYNTIIIGTQTWMKENLKTTKYNNGKAIPNVTSTNAWNTLETGASCNYENSVSNALKYGRLYNYYAVMDSNKICPTGWHIPTIEEWDELINTLIDSAAGKMKSTTTDWIPPNVGATNESGFTALPGGLREAFGGFVGLGIGAYFWSSTEYSSNAVYNMELHNNSVWTQGTDYNEKEKGFSVRCIKDNTLLEIIPKNSSEVTVYPSPAKDKLFIINHKSSLVKVTIFDLQGKQVIRTELVSGPIDMSEISKGIYIVKIIDAGKIITRKIIKE